MFKSPSLLLIKTSWWQLLLGGAVTLLLLVLLLVPELPHMNTQASTAQEKRAIGAEELQATVDEGWRVVEGMFSVFRLGALTPDGRRDWERAQLAMEQAQQAPDSGGQAPAFSANDMLRKAMQTGIDNSEKSLKSAQAARQKIETARDAALQRLREAGQDTTATQGSFAQQLQDTAQQEAAARGAMADLVRQQAELDVPLAPELKRSIHRAAANYARGFGVAISVSMVYLLLFALLLGAKFMMGRSRRALEALAAAKEEEAQAINLRRQMTEAQLQTLQAQVEPHFLYNTLANVQAMTEVDPPAAHRLVGHLIQYLRAAVPKMRENRSTVGQELERVRAYLNVLQIRMGARLAFEIQVPDDVLPLPLPPMMLPTLVENAIKHGLEPKREGGRIDVRVMREWRSGREHLVLQVQDTGAGLSEQEVQAGSGLGLSNLRERLHALYGDDGRFTLQANETVGALATLDIPVQAQATAPANSEPGAGPQATPGPTSAPAAMPGRRHGWPQGWRAVLATWVSVVWRSYLLVLPLPLAWWLLTGTLQSNIDLISKYGYAALPPGVLGGWVAIGLAPPIIGVLALVVLRYGVALSVAGLLLLIPAVVLISMFPLLSALIPIGLVARVALRRRSAKAAAELEHPTLNRL